MDDVADAKMLTGLFHTGKEAMGSLGYVGLSTFFIPRSDSCRIDGRP